MKSHLLLLCLIAKSGGLLHAQAPDLHPPVLGWTFNAVSGALAPVAGAPGSAVVARTVMRAGAAWPCPKGRAVVVRNGSETQLFDRMDGGEPLAVNGLALLSDVAMAAWSQDGKTAVLYSGKTHALQIVDRADGQWRAAGALSASGAGSGFDDLAVSDTGLVAAINREGVHFLRGSQFERPRQPAEARHHPTQH